MGRRLATCVLLPIVAACSTASYPALPEPDSATVDGGTSTTAPPPTVALRPVEGTTTTSPLQIVGGRAAVGGQVLGPDGPVVGAVVRLERVVGDATTAVELRSGADGRWAAEGVLGGRYRVRAWSPPVLAMAEPEVLFLEIGDPLALDLRLDQLGGVSVRAVVAPDPPPVGVPANLVVRVVSSVVDGRGVVRADPLRGASVALTGPGAWELQTPSSAVADSAGDAAFRLVCRASGDQPLRVVVATLDLPLELSACA